MSKIFFASKDVAGLGTGLGPGEQGRMAAEFYQAIDDCTNTTISLTGHSLGSGLRGYRFSALMCTK